MYINSCNFFTHIFTVISLFSEKKAATPEKISLKIGDTYYLRLRDNVPDVESCELIAPTPDRYYERDLDHEQACGYKVKNVTAEDSGQWNIVAVGKIVYEAQGILNVVNKYL